MNFARKAIPYLIGATFITPLIIRGGYIFPFIVPKILFLRSMIMVLLGCYLVVLISDVRKYRPRFSLLTVSILLFWLSFAISTFAGVDWYRSFWDNHERMLGLFTITHYVLLYLIASAMVTTDKQWNTVFRSVLLFGSLVMLIGMWQRFVNPEALLNNGGTRVSATLGNAIYYSGYGLFLLFLGAIQYFRERSQGWKWIALATACIGFIGIFLGGTRGAILGLLAGAAVVLGCYAFVIKEKTRTRTLARYAVGIGVVCSIAFVMFRQTPFISSLPGIGRLANTSFFSELVTGTRGMAWKVAVEAWKDRPVFGWGPNNYYYAFNEHYNPRFLEFGWSETWFDNAHSVIFNTLAVQGTVGIVVYLAIYVIGIIYLAVGIRRNKVSRSVGFFSIGFLVAHLVGLATVFENPTSYLYFVVFLGFVTYLSREVRLRHTVEVDTVEQKKQSESKTVSVGIIGTIAFLLLCIVYVTDINPARANRATAAAMQRVYSGIATPDVYAEPLRFGSPHIDDIRNDISRSILETIPTMVQNKKTEHVGELLDRAIAELKANRLLHPLDVRVNFTLYSFYNYAHQLTGDANFLREAEAEIKIALNHSEKRQQFEYALAQNLVMQEKIAEAKGVLRASVENNAKIGEGWYRLAALELSGAEGLEGAQRIIDEALSQGVVFDAQQAAGLEGAGIVLQ